MTKKTRKWITKIRLYRFQSYVDETITFDCKTNTFVGKTDAGKSAISRAIYWVLYNRPIKSNKLKQDELITWGEKHCFVTLYFSDGTEITRGRKGDENYYILVKPNGEKLEFKGFGFEVPREITAAHGMHLMTLDDGSSFSLNISRQLDPIFLFEESSSKRAKTIGKISGADKIDGALGIVNSWKNDANAKKREVVKNIKALTEKLKSFNIIDDLEVAINTLEELVSLVSDKEQIHTILESTLNSLRELQIQKEELLSLLSFENKLINLNELEERLIQLNNRRTKITTTYNKYATNLKEQEVINILLAYAESIDRVDTYINDALEKLTTVNNIQNLLNTYKLIGEEITATTLILNQANNIEEVSTAIELLMDKIEYLQLINAKYFEYITLETRISKGNQVVEDLSIKLDMLRETYKQYLSVVKECPFCSSKISEDKLNKLNL